MSGDEPEETYEGLSKDVIEKDLRAAFEDGIEGFFYEETAQDIYDLSTTERGWKKPIEYTPLGDAAHWGLTDLYPEVRAKLEELVRSGEPFRTGRLDSKKAICGFALFRKLTNGPLEVSVWAAMDEGADLVNDAVPNGASYDFLTDADIDAILDEVDKEWWQLGYSSETERSEVVSGDTGLDEILKKAEELLEDADAQLEEAFEDVKARVRDAIVKNGGISAVGPLSQPSAFYSGIDEQEYNLATSRMRDATKEEEEGVANYVRSISKGTGVNFFDLC